MVKINGVEAKSVDELPRKSTPSINEILERMDNNYMSRQAQTQTNSSNNNSIFNLFGGENTYSQNQNSNVSTMGAQAQSNSNNDGDNLLLSILPLLLSKDKNKNFKDTQNMFLKKILKQSNNPMISKLFQIMSTLKQSKTETKTETKKQDDVLENKNNQTINDFVKAEDYQNQSDNN